MSTSTLLLSLFKYKAWANAELFAQMQKLEPDVQQSERHAAIRILNHVYVVDRIFAAHLSGTTHPYTATNTTETPTLEELHFAVADTDQWYVDYVSRLAPEHMPEMLSFAFTDGDSGRMSREEMLVHVATHGGYHRGAVGQIMKQVSVAPPRDIMTRFLHDSEPERRVATAMVS
jgi:uncharacterized damage-inducible protein DinB